MLYTNLKSVHTAALCFFPRFCSYNWHIPLTYVTSRSPHKKHTVWIKTDSGEQGRNDWMIFNMKLVHVIYCVKRSCLVSTFFMLPTIPVLKIITQNNTGTTLTYIKKITYDCLQMLSNYKSKFVSLEFSETRLHLFYIQVLSCIDLPCKR